ncbi:MAG: TIGR00266 family protein [Acidobacteriota bacterium]
MSDNQPPVPPAAPPAAPAAAMPSTPSAGALASQGGIPFRLDGRPDFAFLTVELPGGQTLKVEASAMAAMDTNVEMKTKLKGGFGRFLSGESLFLNEFTAQGGAGRLQIAPGAPGDLQHVYLKDQTIYLQNSAFVASSMEIATESKWQGFTKGFFSGESLFLIRCSGTGDLWFNTYGAIVEVDVTDSYVVDTGFIVAFTDGLDYNVGRIGGYKSLFFSGEGFVCRFSGQGRVWIQTRQVPAFARYMWRYRPVKDRG